MFELVIGGAISFWLFKYFFCRLSQYSSSKWRYLFIIPMLISYILISPSIFSIMWRSPYIAFGILTIILFSVIDWLIIRKHHDNLSQAWWNYRGKVGNWFLVIIAILCIISLIFAFIDINSAYNVLMPTCAALWFLFLECLRQQNQQGQA